MIPDMPSLVPKPSLLLQRNHEIPRRQSDGGRSDRGGVSTTHQPLNLAPLFKLTGEDKLHKDLDDQIALVKDLQQRLSKEQMKLQGMLNTYHQCNINRKMWLEGGGRSHGFKPYKKDGFPATGVSENFSSENKPVQTYAELIKQAIDESPYKQLSLSEIYSWFQTNFRFFRESGNAWKSAVRHNLSLHAMFKRTEQATGSFWTVKEDGFTESEKNLKVHERDRAGVGQGNPSFTKGRSAPYNHPHVDERDIHSKVKLVNLGVKSGLPGGGAANKDVGGPLGERVFNNTDGVKHGGSHNRSSQDSEIFRKVASNSEERGFQTSEQRLRNQEYPNESSEYSSSLYRHLVKSITEEAMKTQISPNCSLEQPKSSQSPMSGSSLSKVSITPYPSDQKSYNNSSQNLPHQQEGRNLRSIMEVSCEKVTEPRKLEDTPQFSLIDPSQIKKEPNPLSNISIEDLVEDELCKVIDTNISHV